MVEELSSAVKQKAESYNERGQRHYERWELEEAIRDFKRAIKIWPTNPDYHLNLARTLARYGDYEKAMRAIGEFIRYETDAAVVERFEGLFAKAMDRVESIVTRQMTEVGIPLEEVGAAVQMWLEYRIAIGRRRLLLRKPEAWAAALEYTVRKVNFREANLKALAKRYGVSESTIRSYHRDLVEVLDIMPCDYRYFRGENNPLDKLVEAAEMLQELEERFRKP